MAKSSLNSNMGSNPVGTTKPSSLVPRPLYRLSNLAAADKTLSLIFLVPHFVWAARNSGEASYFTPKYQLITPTIVMYEVYKKIKREQGEETAYYLQDGSIQPRWFH